MALCRARQFVEAEPNSHWLKALPRRLDPEHHNGLKHYLAAVILLQRMAAFNGSSVAVNV
jgi:hypothetical protein